MNDLSHLCGASMAGSAQVIGPCLLRADHDGPVECTKCTNRRENEWGCPDTVCKECSDGNGAIGAVVWPCATITALDQTDLPAVREFAAGFDPRQEPPCQTT